MLMGLLDVSKKSILLAQSSRSIIFIFRHMIQDCLLKKSAISKCWRDGLDAENPFRLTIGFKLRSRLVLSIFISLLQTPMSFSSACFVLEVL